MKAGDWLILILATLLVGALYGHFWTAGAPADRAVIHTVSGQPRSAPLNRDQHLHVAGPLGDSEIEIRDGRARFVDSPCNDKFCVHYGWLDHSGEVIACLPNGVVVQLAGRDRAFDAINF